MIVAAPCDVPEEVETQFHDTLAGHTWTDNGGAMWELVGLNGTPFYWLRKVEDGEHPNPNRPSSYLVHPASRRRKTLREMLRAALRDSWRLLRFVGRFGLKGGDARD